MMKQDPRASSGKISIMTTYERNSLDARLLGEIKRGGFIFASLKELLSPHLNFNEPLINTGQEALQKLRDAIVTAGRQKLSDYAQPTGAVIPSRTS